MTTLWYLVLALLPSFVQRPLRNLAGARIERGARVSWLSLVAVRDLRMARGARIGALTMIKGPRTVALGAKARIDSMVLVNCRPGPRARLTMGAHSRLMSFSVIEPSEGITIGEETGLGGQCLIFCHGSWPNYLEGAPYARGPVEIGSEVWIPWRVMILPNTRIPDRSVIGAHSLVRGVLDQPGALYSGVPARQVVDQIWRDTDPSERRRRLEEVFEGFCSLESRPPRLVPIDEAVELPGRLEGVVAYALGRVAEPSVAATLRTRGANVVDFDARTAWISDRLGDRFVGYLETYGIRIEPTPGK